MPEAPKHDGGRQRHPTARFASPLHRITVASGSRAGSVVGSGRQVKVRRDDPTDLHEQVAAEIRRAIAEGEEFRRGRGITVAATPDRSAITSQAHELVAFARKHGYAPRELIRIIESIGGGA